MTTTIKIEFSDLYFGEGLEVKKRHLVLHFNGEHIGRMSVKSGEKAKVRIARMLRKYVDLYTEEEQ